ncbi:hypothetical protein JXA47_07385, partial [Candidatus Sumerlaeota bacterium]|nr:hypothetical protein [Candidatus Sumerlaeota bacterium]
MARVMTLMAGALVLLCSAAAFAQTPISIGQTINGNLGPGDQTLPDGEYLDAYSFNAEAGTSISIRMNSNEIDTYIILMEAGGHQEDNDDFAGTNSGIDWTLTSSGMHQIGATSYGPGETGGYTLSLTPGGATAPPTGPTPPTGFGPPTPPTPPVQPTPPMPTPGFGTPPTPAPGFGTPPTTQPTPAPGFGTPPTPTPGFGTPPTPTPGFGTPPTPTPAPGTPPPPAPP